MKNTNSHIIVPLLLSLAANLSHAASVSENFEGGLGAWTTTGDVAILSTTGGNIVALTTAFTGGIDDLPLLNVSGVDPVSAAGGVDSFSGLTVGALDLNAIDQATEGSAFKQTFNVLAGETFSFDWQLATREDGGLDYGFVVIGSELFTLANAGAATVAATDPNYITQTGNGLTRFEYVFTSDASVTVAFGVVDVGDYSTSTSLVIDNVSIVPEPTTALLAALGALTLVRRRR